MKQTKTIYYYVSGHGFGHATRSAEVIRFLNLLAPELKIIVKTVAPKLIFQEVNAQIEYRQFNCDVGVVQTDGIHLDISQTRIKLKRMLDCLDSIAGSELHEAKTDNVVAVVSDVSSFPFTISKKLGIPGIGISNFSWDWIYESWLHTHPGFKDPIIQLKTEYSNCTQFLRLPFSDEMPVFPSLEDIPLIGRKASMDSSEVRFRLGLDRQKKLVLLSFGGLGLQPGSLGRLADFHDYLFISTISSGAPGLIFTQDQLIREGVRYPDLVRAADVVVTKPGYGIVSECFLNRTPMLYTDRGAFREYDVIVENLENYLPATYISQQAFFAGEWLDKLNCLLEKKFPSSNLPVNGAEIAAEKILELIFK